MKKSPIMLFETEKPEKRIRKIMNWIFYRKRMNEENIEITTLDLDKIKFGRRIKFITIQEGLE